MNEVGTEDLVDRLSLDLDESQKAILFEFTRARQVMDVLRMPGWEHINDLVNSKIDTIELKYLATKNVSKDTLWAMHVALQYVREFWKACVDNLNTTANWVENPDAVMAKLSGLDLPDVADLPGEVGITAASMPRFPEDKA